MESISDILRNEGNSLLAESKEMTDYISKRNKIIDSMICYEESIKESENNSQKYKAYKNLCTANNLLFELSLLEKKDDFECLFQISLELYKNYHKIIYLDMNLDAGVIKLKEKISIITDELIYIISESKELKDKEKLGFLCIIDGKISWEIPDAKNYITNKVLNLHFANGINHFDKKNYIESFSELSSSLTLCKQRIQFQSLINDFNIDNEKINDVENYLMLINFHKCINKSDENLKKGLFDNIELDMSKIFRAIDICREAIQISEALADKETECIAYSKLLKIYHKIYKVDLKVTSISRHITSLLDSLKPKSFKGQEWYEESEKIFDNINFYYDQTYNQEVEKFNKQFKKEFEDLQMHLKKSHKDLVEYIFKTYPPDYIPQKKPKNETGTAGNDTEFDDLLLKFDYDNPSDKLKDNIVIIIKIYYPNKSKMEPKLFSIYTEILKCLNRISYELNQVDSANVETEASSSGNKKDK